MTSYRVLDSQPPIERPRVTVADNRNVDFRIVIVLILCSFVASVILGVAAYLLTGWPAPVIVIADMVLLYRFSKWLIPQLTGDAVALQEISGFNINQRLQILKDARITEAKDAQQHAERMAEIMMNQRFGELQAQLKELHMVMENMNRRLLTDSVGNVAVERANTFVPAQPEPLRAEILQWVHTLYGENGNVDEDKVDPETGYIKVRTPFSARGSMRSRDDKVKARQMLMDMGIVAQDNGNNYYLDVSHYPTSRHISRKYI